MTLVGVALPLRSYLSLSLELDRRGIPRMRRRTRVLRVEKGRIKSLKRDERDGISDPPPKQKHGTKNAMHVYQIN